MERCGQRVAGRVRTRALDHLRPRLQPGHRRPAGRERQAEVAEPAVGVEHPLARDGSKHRHHPAHECAVHLGVDLDEVER